MRSINHSDYFTPAHSQLKAKNSRSSVNDSVTNKVTKCTPSHALGGKFSLIIVGWWRLRISDGKFVKHTTEMILWSMILNFPFQKSTTPQSYFHAHILNFQAMLECFSNKKVNIWFRMFPNQALNEILRLLLVFMTTQLFRNDAKYVLFVPKLIQLN